MQSGVRDKKRGKTSNQRGAYQAYVEEEQGEARGEAVTTPEDVNGSGYGLSDEPSGDRKQELDARAKAATQSNIE